MAATINLYKTENQIYKDFKGFVEVALSHFSISGWDVKKLNQVIKSEELKPCIFIQILNKKQVGAEWRKNVKETDVDYTKKYYTRNEINIRFSAIRRRLIGDDTSTYNDIDVLTLIRAYFQTLNGISTFAAKSYAQYRASDVQVQSFTNDDENVQLMPYFDCSYIYTDCYTNTINKIDYIRPKDIEGV